jgi:glycosyltransferase involved in cell wall biosynthesis
MKISVIIPCFNAGETLADQLTALTNQVLFRLQPSDWEIIVSDNLSTDNSLDVAKRFFNQIPNLVICSASDRQGVAHARNIGARVAKGEFLAFCDADDVVSETWVEAMFDALSHHRFVASRFDHQKLNGMDDGVQTSQLQDISPRFLQHAGGCGMGVHASIHQAVGGFDEEIAWLEDMEYSFRVQVSGCSLFFAPQAVIHIRHRATAALGFKQAQRWAELFPLICKRYRSSGLRRSSVLKMVKAYLGTIKRVIQCCLKGELKPCLWELGWRWGYLIGCIRHRSMPFVELRSSITKSRSPFIEPPSSFTESRSDLV